MFPIFVQIFRGETWGMLVWKVEIMERCQNSEILIFVKHYLVERVKNENKVRQMSSFSHFPYTSQL